MKLLVDPDLCEANGVCVRVAPEQFSLDDADTLHIHDLATPSAEQQQRARDAVRACPKGALRMEE
ncbi:ferredoxin [Haliangium ochraceum]|uniref:Ferredoxin n=1 Tax=Haliangium ochraceum (strain DSM 14365 / JCM 11303 / SMP-2) TaxID=502025 RepID=D0LGV6_HALO1|nr:ferredoxin [Haliangium ochraceum]ACY14678.1 hypothetical protein Hoch_2133 [Haliangium ochraceum DSM 14365]